ncbi:hypothetical protein CGI23_25325 [Vibrio parahaemolyticus]|uniref:hypothetical protein n=1 Tax=Vibrio parahaemolyticus TaxID=670 RepID=UPI0011243AA0|nr:hypothetical protein [Vibrio parahaemolyticus]TOK17560.1 hypothetical protein CGI23_25325 [Vibrio parahaemolyticus]
MPTFNVTYFNAAHTVIDSESIFMKSLVNAKRSAITHAPDNTNKIIIKDLMERTLSQFEMESDWTDSPDEQ